MGEGFMSTAYCHSQLQCPGVPRGCISRWGYLSRAHWARKLDVL